MSTSLELLTQEAEDANRHAAKTVVNPHFLIQSQVRNVRSCSGVKGDV